MFCRECERMPINMADWNTGERIYSLKEKILSFLRKNPDKAFDIREIIEGTGYSIQVVMQGYSEVPEKQFHHILEHLAEEGFVEIRALKKSAGEGLYYKAINLGKNLQKLLDE
jgi:hypothetical protein